MGPRVGASLHDPRHGAKSGGLVGLKGLLIAPVDRLTPGTSVREACRVMDEKKIGALAVVEDQKLRGIFTYRDLISRIVLAGRDPETTAVGDVMTEAVTALTGEHSYGDALRLMVEHDYTYLPIVDEKGNLAGMLSLRNLLDHRIDDLASQLDSVTRYFSVDGIGGD
jgi:CBS domain-containing protein